MNKIKKALNSGWSEFVLLSLMSASRFLYYGFRYFPQLDDYIQYHNYTAGHTIAEYWKAVERVGLLGARPLAGLSDIYIWSSFWGCKIVAVLLISTLLAASAVLYKKVFSRYFHCGWVFLIIYTLLPLGIEGTYWMSASTRIVCGLFLSSIAAYCFCRWCDTGWMRHAVFCVIMQTAAFCYYEQVLVFSFSLNILLMICELKKRRGARPWLALTGLGSAALYFVFTRLFSTGSVYTSRTSLVLPTSFYYFDNFLPEISGQIGTTFAVGGFFTLAKGFWRGIKLIFTDGAILYAVIALILCAGSAFIIKHECISTDKTEKYDKCLENTHYALGSQLLFALLLAAAPVLIFFVIANPWFSLRNAVPSLVGIALAIDGIIIFILEKIKHNSIRKSVYAVLAFLMSFTFVTAAISELHDYKLTYEKDNEIASLIIEACDNSDLLTLNIAIFNIEPSYLESQNFNWHEHIHGATESSWALRGLVNSYLDGRNTKLVPIALRDTLYREWNYDTMQLENFDVLLYYHPETSKLERVELKKLDEGRYKIMSASGEALFNVREQDKIAYMEPAATN